MKNLSKNSSALATGPRFWTLRLAGESAIRKHLIHKTVPTVGDFRFVPDRLSYQKILFCLPESFEDALIFLPALQHLADEQNEVQILTTTNRSSILDCYELAAKTRIYKRDELLWGSPLFAELQKKLSGWKPDLVLAPGENRDIALLALVALTQAPVRMGVDMPEALPFLNLVLQPSEGENPLRILWKNLALDKSFSPKKPSPDVAVCSNLKGAVGSRTRREHQLCLFVFPGEDPTKFLALQKQYAEKKPDVVLLPCPFRKDVENWSKIALGRDTPVVFVEKDRDLLSYASETHGIVSVNSAGKALAKLMDKPFTLLEE